MWNFSLKNYKFYASRNFSGESSWYFVIASNQIVLGWYLLLFDYKLQQNRGQVWFW